MNRQVKRNIERFPEDFMFQLTSGEWASLKCQIGISKTRGGDRHLPYAFTEQGVAALSGILRSSSAIQVNIMIVRAFVAMRRYISANAGMFQRIESLERKQIETDLKIDRVLDCLEEGTLKERAHVFSAGQIYDAKSFIAELIGRAKSRVVLIDGYVSNVTIDILDARAEGVTAVIYTSGVGASLAMLREQYAAQYPGKPLEIRKWRTEQHDRWLVIDDELWHCGASIKDAGARTFGIDPIGLDVNVILGQV